MKRALADMVRSLGLMAVIVAAMLFVGARYLIMPGSADRMPTADFTSELQAFPRLTHVPVLAPTGLPSSWRANAARLTHPSAGVTQMHIGWATPSSRFAGLDEANGDPNALLTSVLGARGLAETGTTTIAGVSWQERVSARGERALTRQAAGVTVVITGDATDAQLRQLAASLH